MSRRIVVCFLAAVMVMGIFLKQTCGQPKVGPLPKVGTLPKLGPLEGEVEGEKKELVISNFEGEDALYWKGGESSRKAKEGKYSLEWSNLPSNPGLRCDSVPDDWTKYDVLSFWLYSEVANNQGLQLVISSENPQSEGADYYSVKIVVNWTGWKKLSFPLMSLGVARSPRGWNQIDNMYFSSNGWNHTPLQDTILYLDEVKLEKIDPYSTNLITNWSFEEVSSGETLPQGWGFWIASGEVLVSIDDKIYFEGNKSVKMEGTSNESRGSLGSNTILVKPGEVYSFSVWHKTKDIKSSQYGVVARFHFLDSKRKPLPDINKHLLYLEGRQGTHDWLQIKGIFKVPEGSAYAGVGLFIWLSAGTVWWDKVELFKVPDDTKLTALFEEEPKEVLMRILPEIKYDTTKMSTHPRLFFSKDDIPKLKEKMKHPLFKPLWEDIIKTADNLLVSPVVKLPISIQETVEAIKANKIWGNYLITARKAIDSTIILSLTYVVTGDVRYAEKAKEQILSILEWESWVDPCHFPLKADLMTGELLYGIGTVYDWLYSYLTNEEKEKIRRISIERGLNPYLISVKNKVGWSIGQNNWMGVVSGGAGVGALAFLGDEQETSNLVVNTTREILCNRFLNMEEGVRSAGDKDGGWNESLGYWDYGMRYFAYFADALKNVTAGKTNLFEEPFLKNTVYFPIYLTMPDNSGYVNFSDSWYGGPSGLVPVMRKFASEYKNPHAQWFADKFKKGYDRIFSFLWYNPDIPSKAPNDLAPAKLFSGINWAILRSDWENPDGILFALKGGTTKDPHGHLDMNHFILNANSERMIIDLGAGAYSKDYWSMQNYRQITRGHNAILVDGEGQVSSKKARGVINKFFHSEDFDYVAGNASSSYSMLQKFFRNVIYVRPDYFIVNDELDSEYEVNFSWLLHTFSEIISIDERRFLFSGKSSLLVDMLMPAKFLYKIESTKDDKMLEVFTENKYEKLNFASLLVPFKLSGIEKELKNKKERIKALLIMKKEANEYEIILFCLKKAGIGVDYINEDQLTLLDKSARELLENYDVIFLANLPTGGAKYLSENQMKTISEYVKNGGGLFVPGGLDSFGDGNFIGTPIEDVLPVKMTSKDDLVKNIIYSPEAMDKNHPALAGIPDKWPQFGGPLGGYQKLELRPDAKMLMQVPVPGTDNVPFLAIREYGKGRTMIFNSTWAYGTGGNFKKWEYAPEFLGRCAYWLSGKNYLMIGNIDIPKAILPDKEYNVTVKVINMTSENLTKVAGKIMVPSYITVIPSLLDFGEIGSYGSKEILCKIKSSETKGNFDVKIDCQTKEGKKDSMEISKTFDFPLPSVKYLTRGKDILGFEYVTDSYTDIVLMEKEGGKNFTFEGKFGILRENKKKPELKALLVEGKKIILKGEELFNSSVPVIASLSINDSGVKGVIKTDSDAIVQIRVDFKPRIVMLNGNSVEYVYKKKAIEIKLPAGDNVLDILQSKN